MSQLERRVILSWPTICVLAPEADIVTNGLPFSLSVASVRQGADIVRPPRHVRFCLLDPSSAFSLRLRRHRLHRVWAACWYLVLRQLANVQRRWIRGHRPWLLLHRWPETVYGRLKDSEAASAASSKLAGPS